MSAAALNTTMTATATASAPAKINLTLDVLGWREDGLHELRSLIIGVDLIDQVTCRLRDKPGLLLTCDDPTLQSEDNLAYRAAVKLAGRLGCDPALQIDIEKSIPVGAGLGGGSSDAATTLRLCNELWGNRVTQDELATIGADLGSDVPLFFSLPAVVVTGRGERVEPAAMRWSGWVLLALVDAVVSTADVYRAWRPNDAAGLPTGTDERIARAATAAEISAMLSNHLTPAVFRVSPPVARANDELNQAGLGPMHVTGTGSTLYRLFDEREAACGAASRIEELQLGVTTAVVAAPAGASSRVN